MNGKGKFIFDDGSIYEGELIDGKFEGFGILTTNKYIYEGRWKNNKKHG